MGRFENFNEYIDWMYSRGKSGDIPTLENIKILLNNIGNPQDDVKIIHVAGTNGKGSTSNFISSTISKVKKCGLFVSPYMFTITDSIKINNEEISESKFIEYLEYLFPYIEELDKEGKTVTYFEVLTAIMFKYFSDEKVDYAVVEVGLGGEWDSTNVIKSPLTSVITTISMDHINVLGNDIEQIAKNKAGIIKLNRPIFIYPQEDKVFNVFKKKAEDMKADIYTYSKEEVEIIDLKERENIFNFRNYKNVKSKLVGIHQVYNASLAIMVLDYFKEEIGLNYENILEGIHDSVNVGRLQFVSEDPRVIFDGSHNAESIDVLKKSLKAFNYDRLIIGFSVLKDKDYKYVIKEIASIASEIVVTTIDNPQREFKLSELVEEVKKSTPNVMGIENRIEAYEYTKSIARKNDLILWCGSLYLIRDLLVYIRNSK